MMMTNAHAFTYYDVAADGNANTATNTYTTIGDTSNWGAGDDGGLAGWRYRSGSGPGTPGFNADAYTGKALGQGDYPGVPSGTDPELYTTIDTGMPNTEFFVRVYSVYSNNPSSRYWAGFSVDGGTTVQNVYNGDPGLNWVDNTNGGLGAALPGRGTGDTRAWTQLNATAMSDGAGMVRIDLLLPVTISEMAGNQDRFNIDGYALGVVPEPGSALLSGLGALVLLGRRRRRA